VRGVREQSPRANGAGGAKKNPKGQGKEPPRRASDFSFRGGFSRATPLWRADCAFSKRRSLEPLIPADFSDRLQSSKWGRGANAGLMGQRRGRTPGSNPWAGTRQPVSPEIGLAQVTKIWGTALVILAGWPKGLIGPADPLVKHREERLP